MPHNAAHSFDWHDIAKHTLTLRGGVPRDVDCPAIQFITDSVLSEQVGIYSPAAIAFDVEIFIPNDGVGPPLRHKFHKGFYGSLEDFREQLHGLRQGSSSEASMKMEGLDLRLYLQDTGPKTKLVVQGAASSVEEAKNWTWPLPDRKVKKESPDFESYAFCLRFAFVSSLVDPPYLDGFIHDIDGLLNHLQQFAE